MRDSSEARLLGPPVHEKSKPVLVNPVRTSWSQTAKRHATAVGVGVFVIAGVCVLGLAIQGDGSQPTALSAKNGQSSNSPPAAHRAELGSAERDLKQLQAKYMKKEEDKLEERQEQAESMVKALEDGSSDITKPKLSSGDSQKKDTDVKLSTDKAGTDTAQQSGDAKQQALYKQRTAHTPERSERSGGDTEAAASQEGSSQPQLQEESAEAAEGEEAADAEAPAEGGADEGAEEGEEAEEKEDGEKGDKEEGGSALPDPEEAKKKAAEMAGKAGQAAADAWDKVETAFTEEVPVEGIFESFGWHLDLICYLATTYGVYYIWKTELWHKILPKLKFDAEEELGEAAKMEEKVTDIGVWTEEHGEGKHAPNAHDLLWFRKARGEEVLFVDSRRVSPGVMETLMCGCGGNVAALAVTNHRLIVQHDKRCMFGTTVLTTNEETIFHHQVHRASLHTDGFLSLGVCTLHSDGMLSGGFNWITAGLAVDLLLHFRTALLRLITDDRLKGWLELVPPDVIQMVGSLFVLVGAFLILSLLFFLICPQSIVKLEIVKQAGTRSYTKSFALPVAEAYAMYDAIMQGRIRKTAGVV